MANDPFQYLQNAGDHPNSWLLIYGPLAIGLLLAFLAFVVIFWRRKVDQKNLENEYKVLPQQKTETPHLQKSTPVAPPEESWSERLKAGLQRTREALSNGLHGMFSGPAKISDELLERMHEELYRADIGVRTADRFIAKLKKEFQGQTIEWSDVRKSLLDQASEIFDESQKPLNQPPSGPFILLVVGVNGVGKTTTIGKLASRFKADGKTVMLCAADTFRAAAIEQLQIWGERNDISVIKQHPGADPAAVAYDGVQAAKARGVDILIIDTAGRLHSKTELMAELSKINRSIGKDLAGAPHETWIVLDATTGQNAVQQCKAFHEVTKLTGIVMTKLDGTAKGGVIIGIADQFKLPIRYIGVGEKAGDLREFNGKDFSQNIF